MDKKCIFRIGSIILVVIMMCIYFLINNAGNLIYTATVDENQDIYLSSTLFFENVDRLTNTPSIAEDKIVMSDNNRYLLFSSLETDFISMQDNNNTSSSDYPQTNLLNIETKEIVNIEEYFNLFKTTPLSSTLNDDNFVIFENNTRKVYLLDPEKLILTDLNFTSLENTELSQLKFSPDGQYLIYIKINKSSDPSFNSFLFNVKTEEEIKIGNEIGNCTNISWSATGDYFSVLCDISTEGLYPIYHIYVYDFTARSINSIKQIEDFPASSQPTWSSDGDLLVMLTKINDSREFLVFDPTNLMKEYIMPFNQELLVFEIMWGSNGKDIVYISGEDKDHSKIYKVSIVDKKNTIITKQESNYRNLCIFRKQ